MKTRRTKRPDPRRRGAALLLSFVILIVLIAIVFQIRIKTMTDARVGRNDVGLTQMDDAIRSARFELFELLSGDADASGESGGDTPDTGDMATASGAGGEGEGEAEPAADSRKDEWAMPQRTEINGIQLRTLIEAENSKYNVLTMLVEDEEEAEEAFARVVRIIDLCREGTADDISTRDAEEMALEMKQFMAERERSNWQRPTLLTDDEEREGLVMPMSMRDFLVLEPFHEYQFRSYRDRDGVQVHALDQFLTVWSSPGLVSDLPAEGARAGGTSSPSGSSGSSGGSGSTGGSGDSTGTGGDQTGEGGEGESGESGSTGAATGPSGGSAGDGTTSLGYAVNVNLAPAAVLKGLFDDRDIRQRFWDDVIEYRNLEEEEDPNAEATTEPIYDEFGEEIIERRAIESLDELEEVRSWGDLDTEQQNKVEKLLTTTSEVFTLYLTARRITAIDQGLGYASTPEEQARRDEDVRGALMRTVRIVVWRRAGEEGTEIVPIIPWEVLDYAPFEIKDYAEEDYY